MSSKPSKVSMRDVAAAAGVSSTAVSLALRNHPSLPEATRERLKNLAKELGYFPNPMVSALMASRARRGGGGAEMSVCGTLGVLTSVSAKHRGQYWQPGLRERAEELGYKLDFLNLMEAGMTGKRMSEILRSRGIQGLFITRMWPRHLTLDWRHFSAVTHGYSIMRPELHRVCSNHYQGVLLAMRHFRRRGCERIGLVMNPESLRRSNGGWMAGYLMAEASGNHSIPVLTLKDGDASKALTSWLRKHRVDAVLCATKATHLQGLTDLPMAHLDSGSPDAGDLPGIDQQWEAQGRVIIDLLVAMLHRNERGLPSVPRTILIPPRWRD